MAHREFHHPPPRPSLPQQDMNFRDRDRVPYSRDQRRPYSSLANPERRMDYDRRRGDPHLGYPDNRMGYDQVRHRPPLDYPEHRIGYDQRHGDPRSEYLDDRRRYDQRRAEPPVDYMDNPHHRLPDQQAMPSYRPPSSHSPIHPQPNHHLDYRSPQSSSGQPPPYQPHHSTRTPQYTQEDPQPAEPSTRPLSPIVAPAIMSHAQHAAWLYPLQALRNTPSIQHAITPDTETILRAKGVLFIQHLCISQKLPVTTAAIASVYFHRFYMRSHLSPALANGFHHYPVAAASLFLACKTEGTMVRKPKDFVSAVVRLVCKDESMLVDCQTDEYWKWFDAVLMMEDAVIRGLEFELEVESPYWFLTEYVDELGWRESEAVRNQSWSFLNDAMSSCVCLVWGAEVIAAAALEWAFWKLGIKDARRAKGKVENGTSELGSQKSREEKDEGEEGEVDGERTADEKPWYEDVAKVKHRDMEGVREMVAETIERLIRAPNPLILNKTNPYKPEAAAPTNGVSSNGSQ